MHTRTLARFLLTTIALWGCEDDPKPEIDFGVMVEPCDVVFTEFMALPKSNTSENQYVELHNPSDAPADLKNCIFAIRYGDVDEALEKASEPDPLDEEAVTDAGPCDYVDQALPSDGEADAGSSESIARPLCEKIVLTGDEAVIEPRGYRLFGPRHARNVDWQWQTPDLPTNPEEAVTVSLTCRGKVISSFRYGANDGQDLGQPVKGVSYQKDPTAYCNDGAQNWCLTPLDEREEIAQEEAEEIAANPAVLEGRATRGEANRSCSPAPGACQLSACGVFFSELLASPMSGDGLDQFIEFTNPGDADVDLQGCALELQIEGVSKATSILSGPASMEGALTVPAHGQITLGPGIAHRVQGNFYGFDLPQTSSAGAVTILLKNPDSGEEIDRFTYLSPRSSELGAPTRGASFELCADRDFTCSGNDSKVNWTIGQSNDERDLSTRGIRNLNCDTLLCNDVDGTERASVMPIAAGDLIITEIYANAQAQKDDQSAKKAKAKGGFKDEDGDDADAGADDDAGTSSDTDAGLGGSSEYTSDDRYSFDAQWFEVYNATDHAIELNGLVVYNNQESTKPVYRFGQDEQACLTIPPHAYRVVIANDDAWANGHVIAQEGFNYHRAFTLDSNQGYLSLRVPATSVAEEIVIDTVTWKTSTPGRSLQWDPERALSADENDDPEGWCNSQRPQQSLNDPEDAVRYHTAGAANELCHACFCIDPEKKEWIRVSHPYTPGELIVNELYWPKSDVDQSRTYVEFMASREGYLNCGSIMGIEFPWVECKPMYEEPESAGTNKATQQKSEPKAYYGVIASANHPGFEGTASAVQPYRLSEPLRLSDNQPLWVQLNGQIVTQMMLYETSYAEPQPDSIQRDQYGYWCLTHDFEYADEPFEPDPNDDDAVHCREDSIYEQNECTYGTPGTKNPRCMAYEPPRLDERCYENTEDGVETIRLTQEPRAGDIIFTELMINPVGSDMGQEWIEFYTVGDGPYDLNALSLQINGSVFEALGGSYCQALQKGDHLVIGQSRKITDIPVNSTYIASMPNNNGLRAEIRSDDITIDKINIPYQSAPEGSTFQRDYDMPTRIYGDRWCTMIDTYQGTGVPTSAQDRHTAGEENRPCP